MLCILWSLFFEIYFRSTFKENFMMSGKLVTILVDQVLVIAKSQLSLILLSLPSRGEPWTGLRSLPVVGRQEEGAGGAFPLSLRLMDAVLHIQLLSYKKKWEKQKHEGGKKRSGSLSKQPCVFCCGSCFQEACVAFFPAEAGHAPLHKQHQKEAFSLQASPWGLDV